jgi:hypothetical protein
MNKIAIIAAMAAGGSLFAQSISYGSGNLWASVVPGQVNGTFSASYNPGVTPTLSVSGGGSYTRFQPGTNPPTPTPPSLQLVVTGPVGFTPTVSSFTTFGYEDNEWTINTSFSFVGSNGGTFTIPSSPFTLTLKDGATTIATGTFTVVPEPETYAAAAALGLVGFGLWSRRSKNA